MNETVSGDTIRIHLDGRSFDVVPYDGQEGTRGRTFAGEFTVHGRRYMLLEVEHKPAPKTIEGLTKRELQIACLVAKGKMNKQIAGMLNISEWTVATYLRRIFAKLNVNCRAAMVANLADYLGNNQV